MWTDRRFAGSNQVWLSPPKDAFVRVPDGILKTAVFLGKDGPTGKEYGGTGYIVSLAYGPGYIMTRETASGTEVASYPFMFICTARHVAQELEDSDFYVRANYKRGGLAELKQDYENVQWWYHPTEEDAVDAAVMVLPIESVLQLDIEPIPVTMFVSDERVKTGNLGIGDEVFVAGLFRNAQGVSRNIPVIRTGNVAMIPNEKIFFPTEDRPDQWLYANLLESRSIGGLSGSPVFIRETLRLMVRRDEYGRLSSGETWRVNGEPEPTLWEGEMQGLGKIHFFGSMIGHWQVGVNLSGNQREAVNMGIAPMVPAKKILEILSQARLLETMRRVSIDMRGKKNENDGVAVMDSALRAPKQAKTQTTDQGYEIPVPTKDRFFDALKKATRKIDPKK